MINATNQQKRGKWKALIEEQKHSGLSQSEFCKKHNLSPSTFNYYLDIFHGKQQPTKSPGTFASVSISKPSNAHEIRLTLPNGFQCTFPTELELSRIKELLGLLLSC
jgi:hypothetical protein